MVARFSARRGVRDGHPTHSEGGSPRIGRARECAGGSRAPVQHAAQGGGPKIMLIRGREGGSGRSRPTSSAKGLSNLSDTYKFPKGGLAKPVQHLRYPPSLICQGRVSRGKSCSGPSSSGTIFVYLLFSKTIRGAPKLREGERQQRMQTGVHSQVLSRIRPELSGGQRRGLNKVRSKAMDVGCYRKR